LKYVIENEEKITREHIKLKYKIPNGRTEKEYIDMLTIAEKELKKIDIESKRVKKDLENNISTTSDDEIASNFFDKETKQNKTK